MKSLITCLRLAQKQGLLTEETSEVEGAGVEKNNEAEVDKRCKIEVKNRKKDKEAVRAARAARDAEYAKYAKAAREVRNFLNFIFFSKLPDLLSIKMFLVVFSFLRA